MRLKCLRQHHFLTVEQLKALPTDKLFYHFRMARKSESYAFYYYGRRCCEICHEYLGDDWENEVGKFVRLYREYKEIVKAELDTRPDQYSHRIPKVVNHKPKTQRRALAYSR